ncbi:hypothetical protein D779_2238 [Imhoffiella purpurea]|uniref:Uncharacterized protein n=1 Tax=Imhoffiella purpurea TaxID=1249627 RepID=W9V5R6_9GAMM|nr:hypothetical protein D779_2238 [Imhoffiella purpurea]
MTEVGHRCSGGPGANESDTLKAVATGKGQAEVIDRAGPGGSKGLSSSRWTTSGTTAVDASPKDHSEPWTDPKAVYHERNCAPKSAQ